MGTWGPGPFDSDTAEDFLDQLEKRSSTERYSALERTFREAVEADGNSSLGILPEEVIAAAAVVAANTPAGHSLEWNEKYSQITEWLSPPISSALASSAIQALKETLPANSWFWRSWVNRSDREEAQAAIDRLISVLRLTNEGGP